MNEDNQNEQQQNSDIGKQIGNQALNMGKQISQNSARILGELAKKGAKALWAKVSVGIISILSAILPWIGVIIFFITVFLPSADYYLNIYINESVSEEAADILNQYCIIDETGVHFNKQEILVALKDAFKSGDIDFDSLGLGKDAFSLNGEEFSDEEFYNSEAANHLYNLMTATLSSELPYIEGSDKEAQGIIKIKRQVEANGQAQNLKYIGIEAFNEMVENKDPNILNFFSLDETWNLWVAKPYEQINQYVKTINGSVAESKTNRDYNIIPVSIPYRTLISQYTMPFEFLMVLQTMTYSSKYVEAVSDLVTNSSQIDFTIFDSTSVTTNVYTVEYDQHAKGVNHIEGNPNSSIPSEQTGRDVPWRTDEHIVETTTVTTTEEAPILANVTKAKTWLIDQITQYEAEEKIGEVTVDTKTGPYSQEDPGDDVESASWYTDKTEYTKETIDSTNWKKAADSITKLHPDEFLGLWKNDTGTYVKGASYNPNGNVVNYNIENEEHKDRPIMNILSAEEEFYGHLEENVKTQMHAEMMREIIKLYLSKEELPEGFGSQFMDIFKPNEFIESNWNLLGSGFWWPIEDTSYTTITSKFGYRGNIGVSGASKFHKGIDIAVPEGNKIIASSDGIVELAGYNASMGFFVKINHLNGIKTIYMHNSKVLVVAGQKVAKGDVIALSGNTGISGGPHLHFGVEVNGEYVDPLDYVNPNDTRPDGFFADATTVEEWRPYIQQAFSELGYTATDEKISAILRQIQTESGGNQFIMQGIVDSNSGKPITIGNGICPWCPSQTGSSCKNTNIGHGLLQFIPTTFYSNMVSGHTNIYSGYDQICACISMLEKRSGSYSDYIGKGTGWG